MSGSFDWVLKQSPRPQEQAKLGRHGTEHVAGRANNAARAIDLQGTSKDDPGSADRFLKLLVIRAGGLKAYRQVMPFFLGMILGEMDNQDSSDVMTLHRALQG